ncbi:MAG: glutathione S-transferase family protein [bacterium]|nr:glutathione S-transferase family protein [bacterium]
MLELYHNAASTCSQKVRLVLDAKGLDYTSHEIDLIGGGQHDPEYVKLNPSHVVPTLVDDGRAFVESTLINEYVDEAYPEKPLRPTDPAGRHAVRLWTRMIDSVHPQCGVITFAIGPRAILLQQPEEVREKNLAAIPDPAQRARRRSVIEHGVEAPEFVGALHAHLDFLDDMDAALAGQPWLSGETFGLADAAALPYVLRLRHLAMDTLVEARPRVGDWFARVESLPTFAKSVTDWLPEPVLAMFRANGEAVRAEVEKAAAARQAP